MKLRFTLIIIVCAFAKAYSQQPPSTAVELQQAVVDKQEAIQNSIVKNIPFENIGPSVMSGRVVAIAVNPINPTEFYVGYASGGLWYTSNNGTTFVPVMDNAPTQNVGAIAVHWESCTIYVGTGENNSSRSSYAGIGILKSTDGGKHWENMGLIDAHHFGRILINPSNPDEVTVGALGHLYTENTERGVYKTKNGGKTWNKTLYINDHTGIIDLAYAPDNYKVMYAAAWDKMRKAWNFKGSGEGSGIYKSIDAGENWVKLSGFKSGEGVGRIGLAVFDEDTVYAVHDSQLRRKATGKKAKKNEHLQKEDFKSMTKSDFMALSDKKLNTFLKRNGFQEKYRAKNVKALVAQDKVKPVAVAKYLEDANALLFDTPVEGAQVFKTVNGGATWVKTHEDYLDDIFYSYGYYFAQIQVNPEDSDAIYISGVPILKSKDGGKHFESISRENVHADHHALWVNPENPKHLINGNDGGVNITYDDGETWIKANSPSVGQFYFIQVDNEEPYHVYGGLQDNGVWVASSTTKENKAWHQNGHYPWKSIMGGDGMQVQVDNRDANIVYTGYQFGNYSRVNLLTNERKQFEIKHELGERPYRFNWQSPILLSDHNQDIVYFGSNKLLRSMDKGEQWEAISNDLTKGGKKGNVAYGTLTAISESPFQFGLIYTGSDDGKIFVTKNGGGNWDDLSENLPADLWVSEVIASKHKKERVYVVLNGYRWDNFAPYIYMSDDYGNTWQRISNNIPLSAVNAMVEDPKSDEIIYVGTDNGLYVSFNNGVKWNAFSNGLPAVAVHDLKIQERENHLLVGTHGRSIYRTNLDAIQDFNSKERAQLFNIPDQKWSPRWGQSWSQWLTPYEPEVDIHFFVNAAQKVTLEICTLKGKVLQTISSDAINGFNTVTYDLTIQDKGKKHLEKAFDDLVINQAKNKKIYLPQGNYKVKLITESSGGEKLLKDLFIK